MGTVAILRPRDVCGCGGDAVDANIAAVDAVLVAYRGVEAVQTTSLGYGVVDIIVADIIVVPLVVGQRGKDGLCGGTGVDVHNGISTFPIVDIPNSGVGSVGPPYFSRVRMGVVAISVVNWV